MKNNVISASVGLDTRELRYGVSSALSDLAKMGGGLGRLARELDRQHQSLTMNAEQMMRSRIAAAQMSDGQRAALLAAAEMNQALRETHQAIAQAENAEKQRRQSIDQILGSLKQEAATLGQSSAQLQINALRRNGATEAQIKQAQAAQQLIAAHERLNRVSSGGLNLGGLAGAAATIGGVSGLTRTIDEWTAFQNRLKLVHESSENVALAQKGVLSIAKETGATLSNVSTVYQRFANNQRELGLNVQQMLDLTQTVSKSISIGGGSAESAAAALQQFGQAMASGVLRGEEFNSVMEQAPGLAQALAKGLDVNIGQLRMMANDGKLTADVVVGALQRMKSSVDADFAKTSMTISESVQVLKTSFTEFVGMSSEASNAAGMVSGAIKLLAANIAPVSVAVGALVALKMGHWAVMSAAGLAQNVAAMIAMRQAAATGAVTNAANATALTRTGTAAQIAAFQVSNFSGALNVLSVSASRSTAAVGALGARMGLIGGASGATLVALAAITASITALESAIDVARGKSGDNWISNLFTDALDAVGFLDSRVESLGTKLYDFVEKSGGLLPAFVKLMNPVLLIRDLFKENSAELSKQAQLLDAVSAKVGYNSIAKTLDKTDGGVMQHRAEAMKLDDLKKSLSETVLKYREQNEQIGKTKEELELLRLETQKEILLKKQKQEFEKAFAEDKNKDDLVAESMRRFTAELELDFQAAKKAMSDFATQTKAAEAAEKQAAQAAQNRAKVDETLTQLSEKLKNSGKTAEELERLKLASMGATQAQIQQVAALQTAIALQEKQNAVAKTIADMQYNISKIGKSDKEVKLMDLERSGASDVQLRQAAALLDLQAAREKQFAQTSSVFQAASHDFANGVNEQRSHISESWAAEKARIEAANAAAEAERQFFEAVREEQRQAAQVQQKQFELAEQKIQADDVFQAAVDNFSAAVSSFTTQITQQKDGENQSMQKISLDFTLPNGKVLGGIMLAEKSFVDAVKNISTQALYNEVGKLAMAKS